MSSMASRVKQLAAEDWENAALLAVSEGGLAAVAVEPLARRLGVTKGSFYAHFRNREELVDAALRRWEQVHLDSFTAVIERFGDPTKRLEALAELAMGGARSRPVIARLLLESEDPRVTAALGRIAEFRIAHIQAALRELGLPRGMAAHRATIAYAAYIGLLHLAREAPERLSAERSLGRELVRALTQRDQRPA